MFLCDLADCQTGFKYATMQRFTLALKSGQRVRVCPVCYAKVMTLKERGQK